MYKITKKQIAFFIVVITFVFGASNQSIAQDIIVPANTTVTWGTGGIPVPNTSNKNIILQEGSILHINSTTVNMTGVSYSIRVYKNAKVFINNSTITGLWGGFRYFTYSLASNEIPGCVIIQNNSTIQGASVLFQNYAGFSGGVIASNSAFENNEVIAIMGGSSNSPFVYGKKAYSQFSFTNCNFFNSGCVGFAETWFKLTDLRNVNFSACGFYNNCNNVHYCIDGKNIKIRISDNIYQVKSYFSGFPNNSIDLGKTIYIENDLSTTDAKVEIRNCEFGSRTFNSTYYPANDRAITLKGCANPEVYSNTITLESSGTNTKDKHGVFLEDCSGFTLEGNTVSATTSSGNPVKTYGIIIQNSGEATNQVYRNTLFNCEFGIRSQGKNRGNAPYNLPGQGLKFLCNDFSSFNSAYYMSSIPCPTGTTCTNNSISKFQQGALSTSATDVSPNFNRTPDRGLIGSQYDFYVDASLSGYDISYLEPSNPGAYAIHYKSSNITKGIGQIPTGNPTPCESRLPCTGPRCAVLIGPQEIANIYPEFSATKNQLLEMVNGGDYNYLYDRVVNVTPSNVYEVYNELLNLTPSHDILALTCSNDLFSPQMVENILITNSYGIKSGEVRDALNNRVTPLDEDQFANINAASESLSEYEILMMQLDNINTEYIRLMNASLDVLIRRDELPIDSIKLYLSAIGDLNSYIKLIDIAFVEGDFERAQNLFDNISQTTYDEDEINSYSELYNEVLFDIYANHSGDFNNMSDYQRSMLLSIIDMNTYAAGISKYLLSSFNDFQWSEEYFPINNQNGERKARTDLEIPASEKINFYPNPAQNQLTIEFPIFEENSAKISVTDISGRVILDKQLNELKSVLDISGLLNGVYIVTLSYNNNIKTAKLIVNK